MEPINTAMVPSATTEVVVANLTQQQIDVVRETICEGYSDAEMGLYLYQCEKLSLDPLARETYTFRAGGKVIIGVGIDGFRKRANDTGCYMPGRPTEYEYDDKGTLSMARVYVKKLVAGDWHEFCEDAYYGEFKGPNPNWKNMARVMLSKCAEARALRRAFPRELGGLYAPEEQAAIERNAGRGRLAKPADPFAPPVVETTAEVVKPAPAATPPPATPERQVWTRAKALGLTGEDVKTVIGGLRLPKDKAKWTAKHVAKICDAMDLYDAPGLDPALAPEQVHGSDQYETAVDLARKMGASEAQFVAATVETGHADTNPLDWADATRDEVLTALETRMGA